MQKKIEIIVDEKVHKFCYKDITVHFWGAFIYKNYKVGEASIKVLIENYLCNNIDFNKMWGSYRIIIVDGPKSMFFCDNAGNMCFFIDSDIVSISPSLLSLVKKKNKIKPNYYTIAQLLYFNCTYDYATIIDGIKHSDPNLYYIIEKGNLVQYQKKLHSFSDLKNFSSLKTFMERILDAIDAEKIAAVISGGTDSRCVLAHLMALDAKLELTISGKQDHIDVILAKLIAEKLAYPLHVSREFIREEDWFAKSFAASDAMMGTLGRYRLLLHVLMLQEMGIKFLFGGVGGELYKNSFINQDFPFYKGQPAWDKFYHFKVASFDYPSNCMGAKVIEYFKIMRVCVVDKLKEVGKEGKDKYQQYNLAGFFLLQNRLVTVSNSNANFVTPLSPLMERDVVALTYDVDPWNLEMQRFQRREITEYCPSIKDIPTDRGLSCNIAFGAIQKEKMRNFVFLTKIVLQRFFNRERTVGRIDECFELGLKHTHFFRAVNVCKELDILPRDIAIEKIPTPIADRIITIGMTFGNDAV